MVQPEAGKSDELDLRGNEFKFLRLNLPLFPVLTCDACTCYGVVYGIVDRDGKARWAPENERPKYLPDDLANWIPSPWRGVPVALHKRRAIEAVDWCMERTISQVGGLPSWIQDAEFPNCPHCKETMRFLAQVDDGAFPLSEGVYYGFLCSNCLMTATTYQQT